MLRRLRLLLGACDLRDECIRRAKDEIGDLAAIEVKDYYDKINSGYPIAFLEAIATIEFVEKVKADLKKETLLYKIKRLFDKEDAK